MNFSLEDINKIIVVVRGGGDLATGVIQKFYRAGTRVVILEKAEPLAIRQTVALSTAIYRGEFQVEDMVAYKINSAKECEAIWEQRKIPIIVDPKGETLKDLKPTILIDGIVAKKNLGTHKDMAPIIIALGPGFEAGVDVDVVVETMRGHNLGKLYFTGTAISNTGIPGEIEGESKNRVIYAPNSGVVKHIKEIGDWVVEGDEIFYIDDVLVKASIKGVLRGLINEGSSVKKGIKCGDIDPRPYREVDCYSISDKARAVGGATLEAAMMLLNKNR
jgi:xanthine dehydrogenase accessory factor